MKYHSIENKNKLSEDDEGYSSSVTLMNKPLVVNRLVANLFGPIGELQGYENLINALRSVEEHDTIEIYINSPGGHLVTAVEIIQAMQECEGQVLVNISGECHSAASLIALSAPNIRVGKYCSMMIHNASYGTGGKASDIHAQVSFYTREFNKLLQEVYQDFLTEQELASVIDGKELWLDSDEVDRRFSARQEQQKLRHEQELKEQQESTTKKSRGRKKTSE